MLVIESSLVVNKTFCGSELLIICDVTLSVSLPHQNSLSELATHPMCMHHYPPFPFTGDWIPQNDAFHSWDTTVTCILYILSNVWVEIWYFWLGFPAGKATIPATFPSQGVLKIACDSGSGWVVMICPLWCLTKWILALFTMRAVGWVLISPLWASTLGFIADGMPCA